MVEVGSERKASSTTFPFRPKLVGDFVSLSTTSSEPSRLPSRTPLAAELFQGNVTDLRRRLKQQTRSQLSRAAPLSPSCLLLSSPRPSPCSP